MAMAMAIITVIHRFSILHGVGLAARSRTLQPCPSLIKAIRGRNSRPLFGTAQPARVPAAVTQVRLEAHRNQMAKRGVSMMLSAGVHAAAQSFLPRAACRLLPRSPAHLAPRCGDIEVSMGLADSVGGRAICD